MRIILMSVLLQCGARTLADVAPNNACLKGTQRIELNLQARLPPSVNQRETGLCYAYAVLGAFSAACERLDHHRRNFCVTCALASYFVDFSQFEISRRTQAWEGNAVNGSSVGSSSMAAFMDGGVYDSLSRAVIQDGWLAAADAQDEADYRIMNGAVQKAIAHKGRPLSANELKEVVEPLRQKTLSRLRADALPDCDVSGFRSLSFRLKQAPQAADHSDKLFLLEELAHDEKAVDAFADFMSHNGGPAHWETAPPDFWVSARYRDGLRRYAASTLFSPDELDQKVRRVPQIRAELARAYPSLRGADSTRARSVIEAGCHDSSTEAREILLESLCRGVPMLVTLNPQGLEIPLFNSSDQRAISPEMRAMADSLYDPTLKPGDRHALLVQGVQVIHGRQYFMFRNSSDKAPVLRMPFDQACRFSNLTAILNRRDQAPLWNRANVFLNKVDNVYRGSGTGPRHE